MLCPAGEQPVARPRKDPGIRALRRDGPSAGENGIGASRGSHASRNLTQEWPRHDQDNPARVYVKIGEGTRSTAGTARPRHSGASCRWMISSSARVQRVAVVAPDRSLGRIAR